MLVFAAMKHAPEQFYLPAEWTPQSGMWMAWPSHDDLWLDKFHEAQVEFVAYCKAIALGGAKLHMVCLNESRKKEAQEKLSGLNAAFYVMPYGDIWFRDTLPIFLKNHLGEGLSARFKFNGWGKKYLLPGDADIGDRVVEQAGYPSQKHEWVLEGGSVDVDGAGLLLTSKQCLLNPNRNTHFTRAMLDEKLCAALGVKKVLWLGDGLINDHTDGHIDTMARFVGESEVVVMAPAGKMDPNLDILLTMIEDLSMMKNLEGAALKVHVVPSPGEVLNAQGDLMPASYMNFLITNRSVIVPTYHCPQDALALVALKKIFPKFTVMGLPARALLEGGGAFHCITQQVPVMSGHE